MEDDTLDIVKRIAREKALNECYYNVYECEVDADCFALFADSDIQFLETYNRLLREVSEQFGVPENLINNTLDKSE